MAETRITNIIVPEVFAPYMMERSLNESRFFSSGVMFSSPELQANLAGGGKTFNLPYWKDLTGSTDLPSETVADTVNEITTDKMISRRQIRHKAWGANSLSAALAGSDPVRAIGDRVAGFWSKAFDDLVLYTVRGVIADNISNDSSDLVVDIASETGLSATADNKISATKTIEAVMKMGDHYDKFVAIAIHSAVYQTLLLNDLIDFVVDSQQKLQIPYYMGLRVIVWDNMPAIAGSTNGYKYHSYLFKGSSIAFAEYAGPIMPVETFRDPSKGSGIDILYTRRQFGIHPEGFSWVKSSDTGITPTDAELYTATSWNRVYDKKNTGVVAVISNG